MALMSARAPAVTPSAGLASALAAASSGSSVVVLEKGELIRGTSALSGGICWIPNNHHMADAGVEDSREDALAYMRSLSFGLLDDSVVEAFVDNAPSAIRWIEEQTDLTFGTVAGYPDYHPEHLTFEDVPLGGGTGRLAPQVLCEREKHDLRGCGQALIGGLLEASLKLGVEIFTDMAVQELVSESMPGESSGCRPSNRARPFSGVRIRRSSSPRAASNGAVSWSGASCADR
nr:FAD-binding protein [Streptomyces melanosporofaciens]